MYQYFFAKRCAALKTLLSGCLLPGLLGLVPTAQAAPCEAANVSLGPVLDATLTRPATFEWQGEFLQEDHICLPSRQSGAQLVAYLLAPANVDALADGSLPVVVVAPGSSGTAVATYYLWSARDLAGHGYLVLALDPQGVGRSEIVGDPAACGAGGCPGVPFQQADNFIDALASGMDYAETREHPWLKKADLTRIGLAGHSLSSRAANYLQGVDLRVGAVVAWDNLASTLEGDAGTPSGGGDCGAIIGGQVPGPSIGITPRVPILGEASDAIGTCNPTDSDPGIKKTGFEFLRAAGVPSMELVFKGSAHGDWAQSRQSDPVQLEAFEHYTRAWFDLYLKRDTSALTRLLSSQVAGLPLDQLLSADFTSAAFIPEAGIDCQDLLAEPCAAKTVVGAPVAAPVPQPADNTTRQGSGLLLGAPSLTALLLLVIVAGWRRRI